MGEQHWSFVEDHYELRVGSPDAPIFWRSDCGGCRERVRRGGAPNAGVFMPDHAASERCESGKHPHCTCGVCWG